MKQRLVVIVGPTGVGKTALAVRIAREIGGEVVSADSRLFYRGLDIGTAKPTTTEQQGVPHHLIDILAAGERFSLAQFLRVAQKAIAEIAARRKLPVLVGGTGQYVWALLEGWEVPEIEPDTTLRRELENQVATEGVGPVYERLVAADVASAASVDRFNPRRVVRALERVLSGRTGATRAKQTESPYDALVIGLTTSRPELYASIDRRIDKMICAGWVDEVKKLLAAGVSLSEPAMTGIGYREIAAAIAGEITLEEAIAAAKRSTRRLIRHQYNWFKLSDPRIRWVESAGADDAVTLTGAWLNTPLNN